MLVERTPLPPLPTAICARPQRRSASPPKAAKRFKLLCRAWPEGPSTDAQIDKELPPKQKSPGGGTSRGFHSDDPEGSPRSLPDRIRKAQSISPPLSARPKRMECTAPLLRCTCSGNGGRAKARPLKRQTSIRCRRFIGRRTIRRIWTVSIFFFRFLLFRENGPFAAVSANSPSKSAPIKNALQDALATALPAAMSPRISTRIENEAAAIRVSDMGGGRPGAAFDDLHCAVVGHEALNLDACAICTAGIPLSLTLGPCVCDAPL